jgi:hypothetical protein
MMVAEEAYEELRVRAKGGFALKTVTVDAFFEGWIETTNTQRYIEGDSEARRKIVDLV